MAAAGWSWGCGWERGGGSSEEEGADLAMDMDGGGATVGVPPCGGGEGHMDRLGAVGLACS